MTDARPAAADTGEGAAPDRLEAIFERFHRVDPARSTAGRGLGPIIARGLATVHGGTLTGDGPGMRGSLELDLPCRGPAARYGSDHYGDIESYRSRPPDHRDSRRHPAVIRSDLHRRTVIAIGGRGAQQWREIRYRIRPGGNDGGDSWNRLCWFSP
ncbi:sensor histidine kinase [Rhodococcus sp. CX]|uniref:ATP-binding protein n=1 Tax=Rhodococcus sp. CX TaxID=2789880 RepID=UPI0018CF4472|nr:sensor histidine kinase [Rhodococcus sp. CX]